MLAPKSPGPLLKSLRVARRLSQEELAHRASISPRHLSCLETGRAHPSHTMLMLLGSAMNLPLRTRNTLLIAAGFAPMFEDLSWEDPAMDRVKQAVEHILRHQEPNPAVVLDRFHNVLRINNGAAHLYAWTGVRFPKDIAPNAVRAMFDRSYGLRECIVGFDGLAREALARLRTEADVDPGLRDFVAEMERLRGVSGDLQADDDSQVALPIHFRRGTTNLRYFLTITTLGTPLDVTAQEIKIESYFPMDAETEAFGLNASQAQQESHYAAISA
jgi:transcriptional regulator with XRE-family HTH domain